MNITKDFIRGFITGLLIISGVIIYLAFGDRNTSTNNNNNRKPDTVFVDSIEYVTLTDTIKETEIQIKYLENEQKDKLQGLDTISNDSTVVLFRKLIRTE